MSEVKQEKQMINCGIIMPISTNQYCDEKHWGDMKKIIKDSFVDDSEYNFEIDLVSDSDDSHIIQSTIVNNIYEKDIIICDVSTKNPNVMFELGLRLAFDKPIVLIKDNETDYIFDTNPLEHLSYPRNLNYSDILNFQKSLKVKVINTFKSSKDGSKTFSYLEAFGKFEVKKIKTESVDINEGFEKIINKIDQLEKRIIKQEAININNRSFVNELSLADMERQREINLKRKLNKNGTSYTTAKKFVDDFLSSGISIGDLKNNQVE